MAVFDLENFKEIRIGEIKDGRYISYEAANIFNQYQREIEGRSGGRDLVDRSEVQGEGGGGPEGIGFKQPPAETIQRGFAETVETAERPTLQKVEKRCSPTGMKMDQDKTSKKIMEPLKNTSIPVTPEQLRKGKEYVEKHKDWLDAQFLD